MAKKKVNAAAAADVEAKKKARREALKNRPEGQRTNSKQVDVIELGEGKVVKTYAYPVKYKMRSTGVLVTSVLLVKDVPVSTSTTFVPGEFVVKVKKGHGVITAQKAKKDKGNASEEEDED